MSPNVGSGPRPSISKSLDVVDRLHLLRVELDHRVVERVVARDHRAEHAGGLGALGGHPFAGPPQCAEVKPMRLPRLSLPIAVSVQNVSPSTTMPEPPPSGTGPSAWADGRANSAHRATIDRAETVRQRTLVLKFQPPSTCRPTIQTGPVYRRPGSFPWTPRGNMNATDTGCGEECP